MAKSPAKRAKVGQGSPRAAGAATELQPKWKAARPLSKSILEALEDPDLFGGMFDAPSWEPWKAFLAALQALPMTAEQLDRYRHHTGRFEPPAKPARYAELVVGRRGGKSRILALIAAYMAAVIDHRPHLVVGEVGVIAVIAKDRQTGAGYPVVHRRVFALYPSVCGTHRRRTRRDGTALERRRD